MMETPPLWCAVLLVANAVFMAIVTILIAREEREDGN